MKTLKHTKRIVFILTKSNKTILSIQIYNKNLISSKHFDIVLSSDEKVLSLNSKIEQLLLDFFWESITNCDHYIKIETKRNL